MKKIKTLITAAAVLLSSAGGIVPQNPMLFNADAADGCRVETLNRGISAINTGSGMLVSWRFLANDADNATFNLYRDDQLIYTSNQGDATCYLDAGGNASSSYRVDTLSGSNVISSENCYITSGKNYFDIPMDVPAGGSDYTYSPNDCSVGDVDGDGTYEIFVKWDPSNAQDNSKAGYTGNVYIDCYTLTGSKLWRVDLGRNIRAGAHYTQFLVADFDNDGKAEMTCKTADGTVDGTGKVIGDGSKDYRNSSGYILSGPEYYTLFDGATGAALDTVNYEFPRGNSIKATWGDDYGNRVDRFLGSVMYLDTDHPSAVSVRGYYTRMTVVAYDVVNKKLVKRWAHDSGSDASKGYGNGNHNCMPADVDGDGRQELILGATCIDDNGSVLWCNKKGHGDAMHLGDLLPERNGLELWICHESAPYGVSLIDARNGSTIFHYDASKDTGRCCAGNVLASNKGSEFWGAGSGDVYNSSGNSIGTTRPAQNFLVYWDGDLEREILDGTTITKMMSTTQFATLLSADGCASNNSTKSNPCLTADLFGDWREEVLLRTSDNKAIRVFCTPYTTDKRITTLMHDPHYRNQVSAEQTSYNQPPHTSFYLGSDAQLPARPNVIVDGTLAAPPKPGATLNTAYKYTIKNANSGLYLGVEGNNAQAGADVQQVENEAIWTVQSAGGGYYYVYSSLGDGKTYMLDLDYGKADNGTNIGIYTNTNSDAQLFKFVKNDDGTYTITTKNTKDASCIGISGGSKEAGATVIQWECNDSNDQKWIVEGSLETLKGTLIESLELKDVDYYTKWKLGNNLQTSSLIFGDRDFTFISMPTEIAGSEYILTACDSKYSINELAALTAAKDITVYVGMDTRVENLPQWLSGWTNTNLTANSSNEVTFNFYKKEIKAGEKVILGENGQSSYCVNYIAAVKEIETAPPVTTTTNIVTTTTTTTTTTTAPITAEPTRNYGDANCDGDVNISDVVMIKCYLLNNKKYSISAQGLLNADVQGTGNGVNSQDALAIQKYTLSLINTLPIQ
ncbi:MAG: rhamnogalacturonan lyase [Ruminococcus sp.]|nr:rhamnogalacturonan lyase [Ruminococcus sp.]